MKLWQVLTTIELPILMTLLSIILPALQPFIAIYNIFITIIDSFHTNKLKRELTQRAALIQEKFDEYVLGIDTCSFEIYDKPIEEDITSLSSQYADNKFIDLKDWYEKDISNLGLIEGQLFAQRTNTWWDGKLKDFYLNLIFWSFIIITLFICSLALFFAIDFKSFILNFLLTLLPIFNFLIREYLDTKSSIEESKKVYNYIIKYSEKLKGNEINEKEITNIISTGQILILRSRIHSVLIFDSFYKIYKNNFTSIVKSTLKNIIKKS